MLHGPNGRDWPHVQRLREEQIAKDEALARELDAAGGSTRQLRAHTPPSVPATPAPKKPKRKAPVKEKRTICGIDGCILARHHVGLCQCPPPPARRQRTSVS